MIIFKYKVLLTGDGRPAVKCPIYLFTENIFLIANTMNNNTNENEENQKKYD